MTTLLESCRVAPPPGEVAEQSLPLTFFDMTWLHFHPMLQLLFYDLPCSKPFFLENVVPKLKESLSLTLKHFIPLSCNLVYPLSPEKMPQFRYRSGDSVSVTISESSEDYDELVGNHPHSAHKFYCYAPQLPPIVEESDRKEFQVLAVQVTLFPGRGVCIGITTHHTVNDAPSLLGFMKSWASITKLGGDEEFMTGKGESLPVFDRSLVIYPPKLDSVVWSNVKKRPLESQYPSLPTDRVRATYLFSQSEIKKLKGLIQTRVPGLVRLSSFVAIAAYMWSGMAKSLRDKDEVEVLDDDERAFFLIPIDLRPRLDPPVPANYFGNCLSFAMAKIRRRDLVGAEGLFLAAQSITADIEKRTSDKNILDSAEKWSGEVREALQNSYFSVAGSSRLDLYGADFGWGKASKQEILSIDGEKYAMTLCMARDAVGGLEVGLSLPEDKLHAFHVYFSQGIEPSSIL